MSIRITHRSASAVPVFNVQNYGTVPCRVVTDAAITSGQGTLSSASAGFNSSHVGMRVWVQGAATGTLLLGGTIHSVSNGVATLYDYANASPITAGHTVSGAKCAFGPSAVAGFNAAVTAASAVGVADVYATGIYVLDSALATIPVGVSLRGNLGSLSPRFNDQQDGGWYAVTAGPDVFAGASALWITKGQSGSSTPSILLQSNCGVNGFLFHWPDQLQSTVTPDAYPYAVKLTGDGASVTNCCFLNAYRGIWVGHTTSSYIEHINGQAILVGILWDGARDFPVAKDIIWSVMWDNVSNAVAYADAHGIMFDIMRADNCNFENLCCARGAIGLRISDSATDWDGGGVLFGSYGQITGLSLDTNTSSAITVQRNNGHLPIPAGTDWIFNGATLRATGTDLSNTIGAYAPGNMIFNGGSSGNGKTQSVVLDCNNVTTFIGFGFWSYSAQAINVYDNANSPRVKAVGCDFNVSGKYPIAQNGTSKATMSGCYVAGWVDGSSGTVNIGTVSTSAIIG